MGMWLCNFNNEFRFAWWDKKMTCEVFFFFYQGMNSHVLSIFVLVKVFLTKHLQNKPTPLFYRFWPYVSIWMEVFVSKIKFSFRVVCFELKWSDQFSVWYNIFSASWYINSFSPLGYLWVRISFNFSFHLTLNLRFLKEFWERLLRSCWGCWNWCWDSRAPLIFQCSPHP